MVDKKRRIQKLIESIISYLKTHRGASRGVDLTLNKLVAIDLSDKSFIDAPPQGTRHNEVLKNAIAGIAGPELQEIANCLRSAKDDLVWREDNALFYPPGADLGEGYKKCNLHTVLIGPDACGYHHTNFSLGIFMLGPRTLYRDHNHDAPELYLNLSEKSGRKRMTCLQSVEKSAESLRSIPKTGAGEGIRTLDPNLGKVVLYP